MANLNESLTIRIQGDSRDFSRELDQVISRINATLSSPLPFVAYIQVSQFSVTFLNA